MNEKKQFKHGSLIFSLPRVYIYIYVTSILKDTILQLPDKRTRNR
jgi:hypothetical protein